MRRDLLEKTLAAAKRDGQSVDGDRKSLSGMPHGMNFRPAPVQSDERGRLVEMFDPRWNWHPAELCYAYYVTIRPDYAKGWALHEKNEDRYFLISGEMQVVTYDVRPDSPTCGQIHTIHLASGSPGLLNIPPYIWHADVNVGGTDAFLANFPSSQYDFKNPDKLRLPLDTPLIPHDFQGRRGW